jgi:hypothetical protein
MGLFHNPFKSVEDEKEEDKAASAGTNNLRAKMKAIKEGKKETPG